MEPVLGLLPGEAAGPVEDVRGDLLTDVGGEAVERDGLGVGEGEEPCVDAVRLEIPEAAVAARSCQPMLVQTSV